MLATSEEMRATVLAMGLVVGFAPSGTAVAQSRPPRGSVATDAPEASAWEQARYAVILGEMHR